jgi:hypothetical protein
VLQRGSFGLVEDDRDAGSGRGLGDAGSHEAGADDANAIHDGLVRHVVLFVVGWGSWRPAKIRCVTTRPVEPTPPPPSTPSERRRARSRGCPSSPVGRPGPARRTRQRPIKGAFRLLATQVPSD